MAIITLFCASHCNEQKIAEITAEKTGYTIINEKLIAETAERFNISKDKILAVLDGQKSFFNNLTHEREKILARIKLVMAELVNDDNKIYYGFASHLLTLNISHILRVCLIANKDFRIQAAVKMQGLSESKAETLVNKEDEKSADWVNRLASLGPWDERLYDIIIPMDKTTIDEAVELITENVNKDALNRTTESQKIHDDFILAAKVDVQLTGNGYYNQNIESRDGNITISLKEYMVRFEHTKEKMTEIVKQISGVKNVEITMGPEAHVPSRYDELKAPPKFLLVDDEREFVQTLSSRLQVRDMEAAIAYDGEEALSHMEKDEADVMVLDLKMPGIDGMEVLRTVKKERPHVEVIILTGHGSETDRDLAMELGAFAYLEKPVDIEVLSSTMKEAYKKIGKE